MDFPESASAGIRSVYVRECCGKSVSIIFVALNYAGINVAHNSEIPPLNPQLSQHIEKGRGFNLSMRHHCSEVTDVQCTVTAFAVALVKIAFQPVSPGIPTRPTQELFLVHMLLISVWFH